jgi:hypothetical protein
MDLIISTIDLQKTKDNWPDGVPFAPALMLKQPTVSPEAWTVVDAPIVFGEPLSVALAVNDQYVRVPLFEYRLPPQAPNAMAHMLKLGVAAAGAVNKSVKKVHIVSGDPVDLRYSSGITTATELRYWFGIAFVSE